MGALLSTGKLVSIIMAINFGGTLYALGQPTTHCTVRDSGSPRHLVCVAAEIELLDDRIRSDFSVQFLAKKEALLLFVLSSASNAGGLHTLVLHSALHPFYQRRWCIKCGCEITTVHVSVSVYCHHKRSSHVEIRCLSAVVFRGECVIIDWWGSVLYAILLDTFIRHANPAKFYRFSNHHKNHASCPCVRLHGLPRHRSWLPDPDRVRGDAGCC